MSRREARAPCGGSWRASSWRSAVVLGLLIAVALLGMVTTARDYRDGAQRALERQTAANALLIDLLSAQSANRAYILLARGDDLRRLPAARDRYPGEIAAPEARWWPRSRASPPRPTRSTAPPACGSRRRSSSSACGAQGHAEEARRRIDQGLSENRFNAFRAEHARLLQEIEDDPRRGAWPTTTAAAGSPSTRSSPPRS